MYMKLRANGMEDTAQDEMFDTGLFGHIDCRDGKEPFLGVYAGTVMKDCRYSSESRSECLSMKFIGNDDRMWCGSQLRRDGILNIDIRADQYTDNRAFG